MQENPFARQADLGQRLDATRHPFVGYGGWIGLHSEARQVLTSNNQHYGTATFEGLRAFRQPDGRLKIWLLDEHLDRMWRSMASMYLTPPLPRVEFRQLILDTVSLNDDGEVLSLYIRPHVWFGTNKEGYGLGVDSTDMFVDMAVQVVPWGQYVANSYNGGARVFVSPRTRPDHDMVDGSLKLAGFYGLFSAPEKRLARRYGCDEAVFGGRGVLLDGTGQEVMIIDEDGRMLVLDSNANILHSTTKSFLTEGLTSDDAIRFPHHRVPTFELKDIKRWRGMALCGTASGVVSVTCLAFPNGDGRIRSVEIGDGHLHPTFVDLAAFYNEVVTGHHSAYYEHLTPAPTPYEVFQDHTHSGQMTSAARIRYLDLTARRRAVAQPA